MEAAPALLHAVRRAAFPVGRIRRPVPELRQEQAVPGAGAREPLRCTAARGIRAVTLPLRSGRVTLWPFILFALGMAVVGMAAWVVL